LCGAGKLKAAEAKEDASGDSRGEGDGERPRRRWAGVRAGVEGDWMWRASGPRGDAAAFGVEWLRHMHCPEGPTR
jgi:hypothetical protein